MKPSLNQEKIVRKKIEEKCLYLNDLGEGVFRDDKGFGSTSNFLKGEKAVIEKTTFHNKTYYRILRRLSNSRDRVEPKCKIYDKCGSCHLLHMNYENQLKFKYDYVVNAFKEYKLNPKIDEVIKATVLERYRNKMQVAYSSYNGNIIYGFYEEESHRIIPLDDCLVQSTRQNEIVKAIAIIMKELHISPYNEDKRTGLIRFALVREAVATGEILVTIVTNSEVFPGKNEFVNRLKKRCPYITTLVQNINTRKTSVILGDMEKVIFGKGYITDTLCGINFDISSKTFYQINPYQTERLYSKAIEYAELTGEEILLDAYCGVGTIGIICSKYAKEVVGVESNKQSVINARNNAYNNKIKNIRFVNMDATEYLLNNQDLMFDCIIMDPPRSGSTVGFLNAVKKIAPKKVIYVSCEAKTLARDIKILSDKYEIKKKAIVDMFIGTYHIETVCLLTKKDQK